MLLIIAIIVVCLVLISGQFNYLFYMPIIELHESVLISNMRVGGACSVQFAIIIDMIETVIMLYYSVHFSPVLPYLNFNWSAKNYR